MHATLYTPGLPPASVATTGLRLPDEATGFAYVPEQVAALLGCAPSLVDVLACGPHYAVYSVADSEQAANPTAMQAVGGLAGLVFDTDDVLRGPVLVVQA